jgi:hypothetical protein
MDILICSLEFLDLCKTFSFFFFLSPRHAFDVLIGRPNYLVYVNTLLFYRVGGGTRIAGFLLAVATILLLLVGTGPIAYIRKSLLTRVGV